MNANPVEAYGYYKKLYPGALVLFRLEGRYVALKEDAELIAQELEMNPTGGELSLPADAELISRLNDTHYVYVVRYRNDNGDLDFPDVGQILADKEADY